jgi:hypothetical protein
MTSTPSTFFARFSLRDLVEQNNARARLICLAGGKGGRGGGGVGRREFRHHKEEAYSCRIKPDSTEQFDEVEFIASLKQDVEKHLIACGTKIIDGGNPDKSSFYFEYRTENIQGHIDISGKRVRDDYYSVRANLNEKGTKVAE